MQRRTKQRDVIKEIFKSSGRPLSPNEIFELARKSVNSLSLATVYRYIKSLTAEKIIVPVSLPGLPDRYELKETADSHHHHFHCQECGKVYDIPGCGLKIENMLPKGFSIRSHEVVLYGDCSNCHVG